MEKMCKNLILVFFVFIINSTTGLNGLHSEQSAPPARVQQCREGCLQKFATEDFACLQEPECSMCWDQCAEPSKINTSILNTWSLRIVSMIRQGSLVSADVTWPPLNAPTQCLVTWEVAGGGLMGNLLTDSTTVELSLWPDTKYRVQVTCKNKQTESITRSLPLTLDTSQAILMYRLPTSSSSSSSSNSQSSTPSIYSSSSSMDFQDLGIVRSYEHRSNNLNGMWKIYENHNQIILGMCAAILVFTLILILFIINFKQNRLLISNDKESLIDNEIRDDLHIQTVHV